MAKSDYGGSISIAWTFIHTGGQRLTSISISCVVVQGTRSCSGPEVSTNQRTAVISSLVAGFTYVPMVTARNADGASIAECPAVNLSVGKSKIRDDLWAKRV